MKQKTPQSHDFIKILAGMLVLLVGIGYVVISYKDVYKTTFAQNKALLSSEEQEISIALYKFNQYVNLLGSRLSHSFGDVERTTRVLRERVESLMGSTFPRVISLEFTPASHPNIRYTRLGITSAKAKAEMEGITYLGNGTFKVVRILYNEEKKSLGVLHATVSVSNLLYKHFKENEVHLLSESEKSFRNEQMSFKITGVPYIFSVDRWPPSFWQFLVSMKFQIFCIFALMVIALLMGTALGSFLKKQSLAKQRDTNKKIKENLKNSEERNLKLTDQLLSCKTLLTHKEQATKLKSELFTAVQERYRQMAAQAQSINLLTSKLILEEAGNDKLLKDIHSVSQEGTTVLRQLVDGFPMKEKVEEMDVLKSLEKMKTLFLAELVEKNIQFTIKGKIKQPLQADVVTLEIVLHNILSIVTDRLLKDNVLQIEIKDQDPFQIVFYDNGYDLEEKVDKIKNLPKQAYILGLDKIRLTDYITHLGWEISFLKGKQLLNSITLSIPRVLKENDLADNVVNIFDYKPYAQ